MCSPRKPRFGIIAAARTRVHSVSSSQATTQRGRHGDSRLKQQLMERCEKHVYRAASNPPLPISSRKRRQRTTHAPPFRQPGRVWEDVPTFGIIAGPHRRLPGVVRKSICLQQVSTAGPIKRVEGKCLRCVAEGGTRDPSVPLCCFASAIVSSTSSYSCFNYDFLSLTSAALRF